MEIIRQKINQHMPSKATFIFKKQVRGRGYYAGIDLELLKEEDAESGSILVEYAEANSERVWGEAIQEGVEIFLTYFQPYPADPRRCTVKVADIRWMQVDSTAPLLTYATIQALGDLFAFPVENFVFFDEKTGEVHIDQ